MKQLRINGREFGIGCISCVSTVKQENTDWLRQKGVCGCVHGNIVTRCFGLFLQVLSTDSESYCLRNV